MVDIFAVFLPTMSRLLQDIRLNYPDIKVWEISSKSRIFPSQDKALAYSIISPFDILDIIELKFNPNYQMG